MKGSSMSSDRDPTSLNGYNFFTTYRNHAVYHGSAEVAYEYAAGNREKVWVYAETFGSIRAQLDEITSKAPA